MSKLLYNTEILGFVSTEEKTDHPIEGIISKKVITVSSQDLNSSFYIPVAPFGLFPECTITS